MAEPRRLVGERALESHGLVGERELETWLTWARLAGLAFVVLEIVWFREPFPAHYEAAAWAVTGVLAAGTLLFFVLAQRAGDGPRPVLGLIAFLFDVTIICAYATVFSYEYGNQVRWALILVVAEAALRYGMLGGVLVPILLVPYFFFGEWWRAHFFGPPEFMADRATFPAGVLLLAGFVLGWLVRRLEEEARLGLARASEAEALRDELGRHVDALEAANRCARALGSSLEIEEAFGAFISELRGFVPFDRTAIVLVEDGAAATIATAGRGSGEVFPPGSVGPLEGSVLERALAGETVVRRDLAVTEYPEDRLLVALGLRSELIAPLPVGARPIGMLTVSRRSVDAFSDEEVELVSLLGRLVATAVQNIRAYEAERRRVDELRRLSAMRADFVSLVSHELRSPMAAVIGAARTLQERRQELTLEQREAFLALIANETNRLATLVGDVLDTSRIEAGTFSHTFSQVDLVQLVDDAVALASIGQDRVRVRADVAGRLPPVHGDRERLRQVLSNLIDNAVKYSPECGEVRVGACAESGVVRITVSDDGPGIAHDQQQLIFEKFGRASGGGATKPGTGLGLFIARSIAEAHGGTLDVESTPDAGATFTLSLPAL
ncbi:MAG TPA: ATP-binding protein [Gaiellaceae bacterium]|nr:ATP-binding protein [Gaiellaceae bacterium]